MLIFLLYIQFTYADRKYNFFCRFNDQFTLFVCLTLKAVFTALVPAFRSVFVMCLMFVGQGFMEGIAGIG
ncbi:MFSD4 [Bugula neritina]|uniref:MFSD4 n=1 Tax=Bugula neritina TaxID=10212 RepID=A0A7J7JY28_BUGNE|nr:MFSD4 [Bugula neritina]